MLAKRSLSIGILSLLALGSTPLAAEEAAVDSLDAVLVAEQFPGRRADATLAALDSILKQSESSPSEQDAAGPEIVEGGRYVEGPDGELIAEGEHQAMADDEGCQTCGLGLHRFAQPYGRWGTWCPKYTLEDMVLGQSACEQGLYIQGWLDQGYTASSENPRNSFNTPVGFNDRADEYQMNQLYLAVGRDLDRQSCSWDIGGRVDLLYGTDYFFVEADGLERHQNGTPHWNSSKGPRGFGAGLYGLAMPQLYGELQAPIGNGLRLKFGHFYSILGYESVMAPENFFYSHTYTMLYGQPFTNTGVLASYDVNDCLSVQAGFTRGWDNWDDEEGELSALAGVSWSSHDDLTLLNFGFQIGDEDSFNQDNDNFVGSFVWRQRLTTNLTYVMEQNMGWESDADFNGGDASWYGFVNYLFYSINEELDFGMRYEYFQDPDHTRVFDFPSPLVRGRHFHDFTFGFNWTPCPNFILRPEFRWDWSDVKPPFSKGIFGNFDSHNQFLFGMDLIVKF